MSSNDLADVINFAFTFMQFASIVLSAILTGTGVVLFFYVRRVLHGYNAYTHLMILLHIAATMLSLCTYGLREGATPFGFASMQATIVVLLAISGLFQIAIYSYFHQGSRKSGVIGRLFIEGSSMPPECPNGMSSYWISDEERCVRAEAIQRLKKNRKKE